MQNKTMCYYSHVMLLLSTMLYLVFSMTLRAEVLDVAGTVNMNVERLSEVGEALSRTYQIPVCVEEISLFWRQTNNSKPADTKKHIRGFAISATNISLRVFLNRFAQKYSDYAWSFDQTNKVVNLFPRSNAPASWKVTHINVNSQSLQSIMFLHDIWKLKNEGIYFNPGRGNNSWIESNSITIKSENACLRSMLNEICHQLPESRYWAISALEAPRVPWGEHKKKVFYRLSFHQYIQPDPSLEGLRPPVSGLSSQEYKWTAD